MRKTSILAGAVLTCAALSAQSNAIAGLDGSTSRVDNLTQWGRVGDTVAVAILTQSCNPGTVPIDWYRAMDPRHPPIATLIARESGDRFEQISNRGYVKHGFLSINASGCGFSCRQPPAGGAQLGLGCSDTYGSSLNASRTYLGPPDEIDPWLGAWDPVGSHFDRGYPDVGAPGNQDGQRSPINPRDSIQFRVQVRDGDLATSNARFYYAGYYVFAKEFENERDNNALHREFTVAGAPGGTWSFRNTGDSGQEGSVLGRWNGATVGSATNGTADGRIYIGVKVTGPDQNGVYRYNYSMHNRDNHHGAASLRIPMCPNGNPGNFYFHDVDRDSTNDWTPSVSAGEIAFLAGRDNSLRWNEIYSFGFDSTAAPITGSAVIDQALPVPGGAARLTVSGILVPGFDANTDLGAGCGTPVAPRLVATGTPNQARIPNPTFGLRASGMQLLNNVLINVSLRSANVSLGSGCTLYNDPATMWPLANGVVDFGGNFNYALPVPNNPSLEGATLTFQAVELQTGGVLLNAYDLSNGLEVRIGNNCP